MNLEMEKIRILAVDDEEDILESYRNILGMDPIDNMFLELDEQGSDLLNMDNGGTKKDLPVFELVTCQQGNEAVETVKSSLAENDPFAVVFLDIRMPPGPDGVWTAEQIHRLDPKTNIVIVTGYSDVPPQNIFQNFETPARLFYIQKPFHWDEINQFAVALGENWKIQEELRGQILERNKSLHGSINDTTEHHENIPDLMAMKIDLEDKVALKTKQIEEVNIALRVVLQENERNIRQVEENIRFNINEYIAPYLKKLRKTELSDQQEVLLATIEKNFDNISSSFSAKIAPKHLSFTPAELQIAKLIKHGNATKEIAELLNLSILTVESYRKSIRKKMRLTNKKENLRTALLEYL